MQPSSALLSALGSSQIYREYEAAFSGALGLPLSLTSGEAWTMPHHGKRHENPFCALMADKSASCAACLRVQDELCHSVGEGPATVRCEVGMTDSAVPIRVEDRLIGLLQTGQALRQAPSSGQIERVLKLVDEWGVARDHDEIRETYLKTPVLSCEQHESAITLLTIFGRQLEQLSNQLIIQDESEEPPVIRRAKAYIHEHEDEHISLEQVAKAVNTSSFYFCKLFKDATGINFTEYVSRSRIEKAKQRLLDPNARISEVAYEVGFQSLTHFNRVFKKVTGDSPTQYREHLALT